MMTFAEQQLAFKRSERDALVLFIVCTVILTLLCVAFAHAYNTPDVRDVPIKAMKRAHMKRCIKQAQELTMTDDDGTMRTEMIDMCM